MRFGIWIYMHLSPISLGYLGNRLSGRSFRSSRVIPKRQEITSKYFEAQCMRKQCTPSAFPPFSKWLERSLISVPVDFHWHTSNAINDRAMCGGSRSRVLDAKISDNVPSLL